jgi:hypothetical protein
MIGRRKVATSNSNGENLYRSVKIATLGNRRRGKHRDLTNRIVRQLKALREGHALEIPLSDVGGVELANLRSAVHRAAETEKLTIETQSDTKNFYVWIQQKI